LEIINSNGCQRGNGDTKACFATVYIARASANRDALKSFIERYQEGIQQVMEKKQDSKSQQEANAPKNSP
jgi:hypothetical protein